MASLWLSLGRQIKQNRYNVQSNTDMGQFSPRSLREYRTYFTSAAVLIKGIRYCRILCEWGESRITLLRAYPHFLQAILPKSGNKGHTDGIPQISHPYARSPCQRQMPLRQVSKPTTLTALKYKVYIPQDIPDKSKKYQKYPFKVVFRLVRYAAVREVWSDWLIAGPVSVPCWCPAMGLALFTITIASL